MTAESLLLGAGTERHHISHRAPASRPSDRSQRFAIFRAVKLNANTLPATDRFWDRFVFEIGVGVCASLLSTSTE